MPSIPDPGYNRSTAAAWALAHAKDPQANGTLCTWFVSNALWAGGFSKTAAWKPGTRPSVWVADFVSYFRGNYSVGWSDISSRLRINAVPAAQPGDIIVYDWHDGGTTFDHMSFVVNIAPGQYPEVSEMGQFDFTTHPWYKVSHPRSAYAKRGWTWSEMHKKWLQQAYPGMKAHLLHINGGYFVSSF